ncbi:hypothetical protein COC69_20365 [Bacillus cereus]|uniref:DUF2785 domain-containing protein n=1 Tax=Bacillus cereus TaxID=1396 RepID=A0A9X7CKT6_BACCE|nr:DUF2785 domain-containing protein [Bacillus cereus]PGS77376.1 hypothetical protein COC69_20365 [Bacillus cereus]
MDILVLQQELELIQQNDYSFIENIDLIQLTLEMVQHIGTTNSYIREMLIFKCLVHFIQENFLSTEHLETLLVKCLSDEFLYFEIQTPGTDGVFTRSYTILLIALIIKYDTMQPFLSYEMVQKVKNSLIKYMNVEKDYRGYIQDKGWANSIIHGSEAFHTLVLNPNIKGICEEEILHCLLNKVFVEDIVYYNQEDERIAIPILAVIHNGFSKDRFISILDKKIKRLPQMQKKNSTQEYFVLYANIKNFLRALFFKIKETLNQNPFLMQIERMLKEFRCYFYLESMPLNKS